MWTTRRGVPSRAMQTTVNAARGEGNVRTSLISLQRANKMLPLIKSIVDNLVTTWDEIIQSRTKLEYAEKNLPPATENSWSADEIKATLNYLIDKINGYIREVEELGCFVEEFKRGVINFPSLYRGRKIFLCWMQGEEVVGHWHELDEGFVDRRQILNADDFLLEEPTATREV